MTLMATCSVREGSVKPMARSVDQVATAIDAGDGSYRLRVQMERSFDILAKRRGISFEDARLLLMNAVM